MVLITARARARARACAAVLLGVVACGQESRPPAAEAAGSASSESQATTEAAVPSRTVALTFDDLTGIFLDTSVAHVRAANLRLLATLRDAGAHATGFVNEDKLRGQDARIALLEAWLDAGMDLGNHTYSHPDLHRMPLADYQADVLRGERVTRPLMDARGMTPRYFRHPFLHTGRDLDTKTALERFLDGLGYTVAPVTIDNYDYTFARAYDRSLVAGDSATAARVADAYALYMDTIFGFYQAQSHSLFGREPAQVLLLHVNRLNADRMEALLAMMRRRGYAVVPLEVALRDPVYDSEDTYVGAAGITWLHRWALSRGTPGSAFAGEPEVPDWVQALTR